jgi:hypothetical protein
MYNITPNAYEPNATRTRLNGAKTLDLWTKQGCKGQNTINYRPQGLAEEKSRDTKNSALKKI